MLWNNIPYLFVVLLGFSSLIGPIGTFIKEPKNKAYFFLIILGLIAGPIWAISSVSFLMVESIEYALFWSRIIYLASILIGLFHFLFSINYLKQRKPSLLFGIFVVSGVIFLCYQVFYTNNFIGEIFLEGNNYIKVGWAYLVWVCWLAIVFSVNVYSSLKNYKELSFVEKEQQQYLLLGNILTVLGSFPANIVAPYFGIYEYIWLGPTIFSIANLIISYGLTQTRFLRLSKVFRAVIRAISLYILPSILFVVLLEWIFPYLRNFFPSQILFYVFIILILGILFRIFEELVSKIFLSETQILRNKGETFIKLLNFEQDLSNICNTTLEYICENTPVRKAQVFLYDSVNTRSYRFTKGEWEILNLKKIFSEIPIYWQQDSRKFKPLLRSELEYLRKKEPHVYKEYGGLLDLLKVSRIQLIYPIVSGSDLVGVLFLEDLPSEQMYKVSELDLLDRIYNQFHISVNKALLYQQLESLNSTLKEKVDEQTKELKKKLCELEEARRKESDMIDIMGHELRTPATVVKLNVDFLDRFENEIKSDPDGYKKYVKRIKDSIENEIKLINTLLSSAKLEGNKIELNPEEIDIKKEIEMALHGYESDAKERGLQLVNSTDQVTPSIYADKARTIEVLNNLISNAIKYTQRGGVGISTSYDKDFVTVFVADTGKGIPEKDIPKLGQKFYRVSTYIDSKEDHIDIVRPGGTGLGLYVTYSLVEKMGGSIHVESEVGKGSVFYFSLPRFNGQDNGEMKNGSKDMFEKLGLKK